MAVFYIPSLDIVKPDVCQRVPAARDRASAGGMAV